MLPKSSKHYIQPTAEELKLDSQLVEDVISFYYNHLRKSLTDIFYFNIAVENLGTFAVKRRGLPKLTEKYAKQLTILTKDTDNQKQLRKELHRKLENIDRIQKLLDVEQERKIKHNERKKALIGKNLEIS